MGLDLNVPWRVRLSPRGRNAGSEAPVGPGGMLYQEFANVIPVSFDGVKHTGIITNPHGYKRVIRFTRDGVLDEDEWLLRGPKVTEMFTPMEAA